ncbi:MAG TPA: HlyD family efflux transporter periplasmic adaptor subunit [Phycisphaerales bacterium]|nr:HlyD family efflux transporter periplasmic adaptor subunit [Phycisphaerales bacterium]
MTDGIKKKARKPMVAGIAVAATAGLALVIVWKMMFAGPDLSSSAIRATFIVQPRDLTISVTESGEIKAASYTDYLCEVEGGAAITEIVEEGTYISPEDVANGRVLVRLDSGDLVERLTQQRITHATAEAAYTEAVENNDIQVKQNESDITAAELAVKFALMDLKKYLSDSLAQKLLAETGRSQRPDDEIIAELIEGMVKDPNDPRWGGASLQNKRLLEANIKLAEGQLERDRNQLRGTQRLYEKQYVATSELERDQLSYDRSAIEVQQSETALQLFLEYDFAKQTETLFSDYVEAGRQLERTLASARAKLAQTQAKLSSARATLELQKARLEKMESQVAGCTIVAKAPGMVIYGSSADYFARRDNPTQVGDQVRQGTKLLTTPNTGRMTAQIRVHESWVQRVSLGLRAKVTPDPFPDMVLDGKVSYVAPLPDPQSRWMSTGLKVYSTTITIGSNTGEIRPGMSAKVEIIIDELHDVLCVPVHAVASQGRQKFCYLVNQGRLEARPVEVGQFNDTFIEIKGGLREGDVISLTPPRYQEKTGAGEANGRRQPPEDRENRDPARERAAPAVDPESSGSAAPPQDGTPSQGGPPQTRGPRPEGGRRAPGQGGDGARPPTGPGGGRGAAGPEGGTNRPGGN